MSYNSLTPQYIAHLLRIQKFGLNLSAVSFKVAERVQFRIVAHMCFLFTGHKHEGVNILYNTSGNKKI